MTPKSNVFLAVAQAMWAGGADGEEIARDLALALDAVCRPAGRSSLDELTRFLADNESQQNLFSDQGDRDVR